MHRYLAKTGRDDAGFAVDNESAHRGRRLPFGICRCESGQSIRW